MRTAVRELLFGGRPNLLLTDTFTGADGSLATHLPDINNTGVVDYWVSPSGSANIVGNKLQTSVNGGTVRRNFGSGVANFYAIGTFFGSSSSSVGNFIARSTGITDEWRIGYSGSNTVISIVERNASTNTTRASASGTTHGTTLNYVVEVTVKDAAITINNLTQGVSCTYASATFHQAETMHGVALGNAGTTGDDVSFYREKP